MNCASAVVHAGASAGVADPVVRLPYPKPRASGRAEVVLTAAYRQLEDDVWRFQERVRTFGESGEERARAIRIAMRRLKAGLEDPAVSPTELRLRYRAVTKCVGAGARMDHLDGKMAVVTTLQPDGAVRYDVYPSRHSGSIAVKLGGRSVTVPERGSLAEDNTLGIVRTFHRSIIPQGWSGNRFSFAVPAGGAAPVFTYAITTRALVAAWEPRPTCRGTVWVKTCRSVLMRTPVHYSADPGILRPPRLDSQMPELRRIPPAAGPLGPVPSVRGPGDRPRGPVGDLHRGTRLERKVDAPIPPAATVRPRPVSPAPKQMDPRRSEAPVRTVPPADPPPAVPARKAPAPKLEAPAPVAPHLPAPPPAAPALPAPPPVARPQPVHDTLAALGRLPLPVRDRLQLEAETLFKLYSDAGRMRDFRADVFRDPRRAPSADELSRRFTAGPPVIYPGRGELATVFEDLFAKPRRAFRDGAYRQAMVAGARPHEDLTRELDGVVKELTDTFLALGEEHRRGTDQPSYESAVLRRLDAIMRSLDRRRDRASRHLTPAERRMLVAILLMQEPDVPEPAVYRQRVEAFGRDLEARAAARPPGGATR